MDARNLCAFGLSALIVTGCGTIAADPDAGSDPDASEFTDAGVDETDGGDETDVDPPETTIDVAPPSPSSLRSGEIRFSSSEENSSFYCRLGAGELASCDSPFAYDLDSDGPAEFEVYAVDAAGNEDPTPAQHGWVVDTLPPEVTISSGPSNPTSETGADFTFSVNETASLECSLDGAAFASCSSPASYSGIDDGNHSFMVRATDEAGNVGTAQYDWTRDASAPSIVITGTPDSPTNQTSANFTFNAEAGTTVACRLDGGAYGNCTSGSTMDYTGLTANVSHTFYVRATDGANNSAVASYSWNIDTRPPDVSILTGPNDPTNQTSASFTFSVDEVADVLCRLDGGGYGSCDGPSSHSYNSVSANTTHSFYVEATDAAGNVAVGRYDWEVDTLGPNTRITVAPPSPYPVDYVEYSFSADEAGATFQCQLDGGGWSRCNSPRGYSGIGYRAHTFEVRALDGLGNPDPTPASDQLTTEQGLVLHYPFDRSLRNASPLVDDHDGDGSNFGFQAGVYKDSAVFDGSSRAVVKLPNTYRPMSNDEAYTISMWVYEPKPIVDSTSRYLFTFEDTGGGISVFRNQSKDRELHITYTTDRGTKEKGYVVFDASQNWAHFTVIYPRAGSDLFVFRNAQQIGVIKNSQAGHIFDKNQAPSMVVGAGSNFTIDDLRVYNRTFTQAEICTVIMGGSWLRSTCLM
jgi:hypothetical protein